MRAHDEVELLLRADGGLVVRRDHPHLIGSFDWLIHQGKLATVLPGIYADPEIAGRGKPGLERLRCVTRMLCCSVLLPPESLSGQLHPSTRWRRRFAVCSSRSRGSASVAVASLTS